MISGKHFLTLFTPETEGKRENCCFLSLHSSPQMTEFSYFTNVSKNKPEKYIKQICVWLTQMKPPESQKLWTVRILILKFKNNVNFILNFKRKPNSASFMSLSTLYYKVINTEKNEKDPLENETTYLD